MEDFPVPSTSSNGVRKEEEEEEDFCRVCRCGNEGGQLFYPCKCTGSIRWVHQDCLVDWLAISKKKYCEVCKHPYQFTNVYSSQIPERLPITILLKRSILAILDVVRLICRVILVAFTWLVFLPWCTCWIFRGWFAMGRKISWSIDDLFGGGRSRWKRMGWKESNGGKEGRNQPGSAEAHPSTSSSSASSLSVKSTSSPFSLVPPNPSTSQTITATTLNSSMPIHVPPTSQTSTNSTFLHLLSLSFPIHSTILGLIITDLHSLTSSTNTTSRLALPPDLLPTLARDTFQGQIIASSLVVVFVAAFILREWVAGARPVRPEPLPAAPAQPPPPPPLDVHVPNPPPPVDTGSTAGLDALLESRSELYEARQKRVERLTGLQRLDAILEKEEQERGRIGDRPAEENERWVHILNQVLEDMRKSRGEGDAGPEGGIGGTSRVGGVRTVPGDGTERGEPSASTSRVSEALDAGNRDIKPLSKSRNSGEDEFDPKGKGKAKASVEDDDVRRDGEISSFGEVPELRSGLEMDREEADKELGKVLHLIMSVPYEEDTNKVDEPSNPSPLQDTSTNPMDLLVRAIRKDPDQFGSVLEGHAKANGYHPSLDFWDEIENFSLCVAKLRKTRASNSHGHSDNLVKIRQRQAETWFLEVEDDYLNEDPTYVIKIDGRPLSSIYRSMLEEAAAGRGLAGNAFPEDKHEARVCVLLELRKMLEKDLVKNRMRSFMEFSELAEVVRRTVKADMGAQGEAGVTPVEGADGTGKKSVDGDEDGEAEVGTVAVPEVGSSQIGAPANENEEWLANDERGARLNGDAGEEREGGPQNGVTVGDKHGQEGVGEGNEGAHQGEAVLDAEEPQRDDDDLEADDEEEDDEEDDEEDAEIVEVPAHQAIPPADEGDGGNLGADDAEAIALAEDEIEGVLEAIGMTGNIANLVQNTALMILLATLCLGISVGVPYLFGKSLSLLAVGPLSAIPDVCEQVAMWCSERLAPIASRLPNRFRLMLNRISRGSYVAAPVVPLPKPTPKNAREFLASLVRKTAEQLRLRKPPAPLQTPTVPSLPAPSLIGTIGQRMSSLFVVGSIVSSLETARECLHIMAYDDSTSERTLNVILGFVNILLGSAFYIRLCMRGYGQRLNQATREAIRQQGMLFKVAAFCVIEILFFPAVCGAMLYVAAIPLLPGATWTAFVSGFVKAPVSRSFLTWLAGTSSRFALINFIQMSRSGFRTGVMWFWPDPNDPTFNPVNEILDRSSWIHTKKIARGLFHFMILVSIFGTMVRAAGLIPGLYPLRFQYSLAFSAIPFDLIFFYACVPYTLKVARPKRVIRRNFLAWTKVVASRLRLSSFMFGKRSEAEERNTVYRISWSSGKLVLPILEVVKEKSGRMVLAPNADAIKPPMDKPIFIDVDENNKPANEEAAETWRWVERDGLSSRYTTVYVPPNFRVRIWSLIVMLSVTCAVATTVGLVVPLLIGRFAISLFYAKMVHDVYPFALGMYFLWGSAIVARATTKTYRKYRREPDANRQALLRSMAQSVSKAPASVAFVLAAFIGLAFILPFMFGISIDLYVLTWFKEPVSQMHTVDVAQDWAIGFVYMTLAGRIAKLLPANKWKAALTEASPRNMEPLDVEGILNREGLVSASKASIGLLLGPALASVVCAALLPGLVAYLLTFIPVAPMSSVFGPQLPKEILPVVVFKYCYLVGFIVLLAYGISGFVVEGYRRWTQHIKDEEYLVERRLENLEDQERSGRVEQRYEGKGLARDMEEAGLLALD